MNEPVITALGEARDELTGRLVAVRPSDWERSTPCSEWNLRQLVNHVVGVQFRIAKLLRGGTRQEYVANREDDWLGPDHISSWQRGIREYDEALKSLRGLEVEVDYRVPMTAREAVRLTAFDTAVHTWDIARAIGANERLPESLATFALAAIEGYLESAALAALFAAPSAGAPRDGSPQARLLYLAGRA